jgi:hypothetical protein
VYKRQAFSEATDALSHSDRLIENNQGLISTSKDGSFNAIH